MLDAPGLVGGRYRPERMLAASGMADVYAAHDERLDRPVALKFLRAAGSTDAARFRREMTTLAQLEHPGLVRLYDADVHDTVPYLVLELVDGPSLSTYLATHAPLDADETDRLLRDLAAALAYVHERGIVHRDVKPSNVLLDPDGTARLTDFGIARTDDASAMTGTAMTIGTAAYLAPEQARGDEVTTAADVYSLGLVLLECRTGARAFPGAPVEAAIARLTRDPEIPASLEPEWRSLLASMTAPEPTARPTAVELTTGAGPPTPDAAATVPIGAVAGATAPMAAEVTATAAMTGALPIDDSPPARSTEATRRTPSGWLVGAIALAVMLVAVAIGLALASSEPSVDSPVAGATSSTAAVTTAPTTTVATTTTTTAPTTTAPPAAVVAASDCSGLEAQRRALDEQKKAKGGPKGDDGARQAQDQAKKQLDDALKACRGH